MLLNCVDPKQLQFWGDLMDSWYATKEIMLTIEQYKKIYFVHSKIIGKWTIQVVHSLTDAWTVSNGQKPKICMAS